jgi:CheY-like chemotaxis protein
MILIIEDNEDIRENLEELLTLDGFVVTTAECGLQALAQTEKQIPDLVICDIMMQGMDGYEVFSAFRQSKRTSSIPFIFSSSLSGKAEEKKAKALGVAHYLVKPFDEEDLVWCINDCLQTLPIA